MKSVALVSICLLLVPAVPSQAGPLTDTRLEGMVLDLDGRPAVGYGVHLIDSAGTDSVRAVVDENGDYRMRGVSPGRYDLALETPEGRYAEVKAATLKINEGQLVRRDLKLAAQDPSSAPNLAYSSSNGFGTWWAGLDKGARAWTIVAIVVVAGITYEALSSDENPASQTLP